jgi:hypothetical protein
MFLSSNSLTSSWLPFTAPAATTPPLTIMRPTLSVSSTIPKVSTSSSSSHKLSTRLWYSKPPIEVIIEDEFNPYYSEGQRPQTQGLSSSCGRLWETSFYLWISTAIEKSTLLDKFSCFNTVTNEVNLVRACYNSSTEWAMMNTFATEARSFRFTASPPCCGGCSFTAGDVQVYHWPPATTSPLVSILVNSEGFRLYICIFKFHLNYRLLTAPSTYPSVYVAFHTIVASDLCSLVGSAIPSITTMAFDASELSTAASYTGAPLSGSMNWAPQQPIAFYITQFATWWSYSQMELQTRYGFMLLFYSHS